MEEKSNYKRKIALLLTAIVLVVIAVISVTYAYFSAKDVSAPQTVTTQNLGLEFDDGTDIINEDNISPLVREVALPTLDDNNVVTTKGKAATKTFTITNTGNKSYVEIALEDITLPAALKRYDFMWSLYEVIETDESGNNTEKI